MPVLLLVLAMVAAGCGSHATPTSPPATTSPTSAATTTPSTPVTASPTPVEPVALSGVWEGVLGEGEFAYPTELRAYDCGGKTCGESEYGHPGDPASRRPDDLLTRVDVGG